MTRRFHCFAASLVLLLSLLFLCGCQTKELQRLLPDIPAESGFAWKDALLTAVNADYEQDYHQADHYLKGSDESAEIVLKYLQSASGNDIAEAERLLSEDSDSDDVGIICTDTLKKIIAFEKGKSYQTYYTVLPSSALDGTTLRETILLNDVAHNLRLNHNFVLLDDSYSEKNCEVVSFAAGAIGDKAIVIMLSAS